MAPSFEQAEQFFLNMSCEMRDMGYFIMDRFVKTWPGLLTIDQLREIEIEAQSDSEEEES